MANSIGNPDVISKGNLYKIALHDDPNIVQSVDGFNVRQEFGDMDWLKESLIRDGMRVPAQGYMKDGVYYITDGHRRLKAAKAAVEDGHEIVFLLQAEPKGYQESDRVLDMLTRNSGLPFTMLEEAHLFARLSKFNYDEHQIAAKTGKSVVHVKNALLLLTAEPETQQKVADNQVAASTVVEMLRTNDPATVEQNVAEALETTGKKKVTAKDIKDAPSGRERKPKKITEQVPVRPVVETQDNGNGEAQYPNDIPPADLGIQAETVTVKDGVVVVPVPPMGKHTNPVVFFVRVNGSEQDAFPTVDVARIISRLKLANFNLSGEFWSNTFDVLETLDRFAKGDIDWEELQSQFIIQQ